MSPCLEEVAEPAGWKLRVWTANTDEEKEGVWKDRYSDFAPLASSNVPIDKYIGNSTMYLSRYSGVDVDFAPGLL